MQHLTTRLTAPVSPRGRWFVLSGVQTCRTDVAGDRGHGVPVVLLPHLRRPFLHNYLRATVYTVTAQLFLLESDVNPQKC